MNRRLPFSFFATSNDCYKVRANLFTGEALVKYDQKDIELFRDEKQFLAKKAKKITTSEPIELYSLTKEEFLDLCDLFPESTESLQDYAIQ